MAALCAVAVAATGQTALTVRYLDIGGQSGQSVALATDGGGNHFIVSTVIEPSGRPQIRVTKTDSQGNTLAAFDFGGTAGRDTPSAVAVDGQGDVFVAGTTTSGDFPTTVTLGPTTGGAAFVVKLDGALTGVLAAVKLGGTQGSAAGAAVGVDGSGNVYVAGGTDALDFPVTQGAFQTSPPVHDEFGSAGYGFLAKLSPDLQHLAFSTYFGGGQTLCQGGSACIGQFGSTSVDALAIDTAGDAVLGGGTTASDLPSTPGAYETQCICNYERSAGLVAKFSQDGSKLLWSTFLNTLGEHLDPLNSNVRVQAIALDPAGDVLVGGSAPAGFPTTTWAVQTQYPIQPGAGAPPYAGFVAKLDSMGSALLDSSYFGSAGVYSGGVQSVGEDSSGEVWLTGNSLPTALPGPAVHPLGPEYVANMAADFGSVGTMFTAPQGGAGTALSVAGTGTIAAIGGHGSLVLPAGPGDASIAGVLNAAGGEVSGTVAPTEVITLYGYNLGPASPQSGVISNGVLGSSLGGYAVLFNGVPAPLLYASANQINCVVPAEAFARDIVSLQIRTPQGTLAGPPLSVSQAEVEIFQAGNGYAAAVNEDGEVNSAAHPAGPGSVVTVWATGAGLYSGAGLPVDGAIISAGPFVTPALPVSVVAPPSPSPLALYSLEVEYAGDAPGEVFGVMQVNFRLPEFFAPGTSSYRIELQVGGSLSDPVSIYVHP